MTAPTASAPAPAHPLPPPGATRPLGPPLLGPPLLGPRGLLLSLAALLLFASLVNGTVIGLDQRHRQPDTIATNAAALWSEMREQGALHGLASWLQTQATEGTVKGPLGPLLALPFVAATGDLVLGVRVLGAALFVLLALLCALIARRLLPDDTGALQATAILIGSPLAFGVARLGYYDTLETAWLALGLLLLLRRRERGWRHALLLGLVMAAGLLTKPSFALQMLLPALYLLASTLRQPRRLLHLLAAAGVALLLAGPWLVVTLGALRRTVSGTAVHGGFQGLTEKVAFYAALEPLPLLALCAVLGGLLLWLRCPATRWTLGLLAAAALSNVLVLALVPVWGRYASPMLVPLTAVTGAAAGLAVRALPGWLGSARALLLPLVLTLPMAQLALAAGDGTEDERELRTGLLHPDLRPRLALRRVLEAGRKLQPLWLFHQLVADQNADRALELAQGWGYRVETDPRLARLHLRQHRRVAVLLVRQWSTVLTPAALAWGCGDRPRQPPTAEGTFQRPTDAACWLSEQRTFRVLMSARSVDNMGYWLLLLEPDGQRKL